MKIKKFLIKYKYFISIIFLILAFSSFMMLFSIQEGDYFWHIKAGKYMSENSILKKDVFSWYLYGKYWFSHEWLFEILLYNLSLFFKEHILIYCFTNTFLLLIILFITNKKGYLKNIPFTMIWLLFFIFIFSVGVISARPHMISYLFLALSIYLLYDLWYHEESKKIYFLPIITLVWANIHGGSSNLSYIFTLVFIICGLFKFKFDKIIANRITRKQIFKYLIVFILCIFCIMLNPHGIKMLFYPYENMADSLMLNTISEWQPSNLNILSHYRYFIFLILILFVIIFSKKKIIFIDFVLFGISLFLGLKSIRFWTYTYIISSYFIFNYIPDRKYDKYSCVLINLLAILLLGMSFINYNTMKSNTNKKLVHDDIISVIKKEKPSRLFNNYNYGGYLIYKDIDVFIDGRADLYSRYNYKDYYIISDLKGDYEKTIDKYDFDYFLVSSDYPIYYYLKDNSEYKLLINREDLYFFKKI